MNYLYCLYFTAGVMKNRKFILCECSSSSRVLFWPVGGSSAEAPHGHFGALILYDLGGWGVPQQQSLCATSTNWSKLLLSQHKNDVLHRTMKMVLNELALESSYLIFRCNIKNNVLGFFSIIGKKIYATFLMPNDHGPLNIWEWFRRKKHWNLDICLRYFSMIQKKHIHV